MAEKLTKEQKKELRAQKREEARERAHEAWEKFKTPILIGISALGGAGVTAGGMAIGKAIRNSKAKKAEEAESARITAITPPECLETPNWGYTPEEQATLDACANLDYPNSSVGSTDTPSV